ncbi:S9 family peptidase [Aestuariivirga sp.]|uniref:S9 family peptidase n=1 Tax=Aestuariivirga sp. TaxID=2650926 RepID=UPI0025BC0CAC|nr:S9 family peptidase [Aestuariivirga sp.]MCA3555277.1 S9 family peptidase [Aestuariivirga sp.]
MADIPKPPRAQKRPRAETWHGHEKRDDYHWLKAPNWQEVMHDPSLLPAEIRAFLEGENAYHEAVMAGTKALQETLFAELKGRIREDDSSAPAPDGAWEYYSRYVTGGQHPLYCRKPRGKDGPEQILLDGNALAKDRGYFRFGGIDLSPGQNLIAWSFDGNGSEFYELRLRDAATGAGHKDVLENTTGEATWAADGGSFFYTLQDDNHRPLKTFRHILGTEQSADALVHEEKDAGKFTGVGMTSSEQWITIDIHDHDTSEIWLIDAKKPDEKPRLVAPRAEGIEYDIEHRADQFIIRTNEGGAEDYKLVTAPVSDPRRENWRDLIPHRPGVFIVSYIVLKDWLVRMERENALPRIVVRNMETGEEHAIAFDEEAYSLGFGEMREFDTGTLRFIYSSPTTPAQVFDYDMKTRTRVLRKTQEVPSGHDPSQYVTRRLMAPAHDGETIPVTLLYRKGTKLDGSAPLWLYGYGSYGISLPAGFNTNILSLVDRGFIHATAHIRGGQEKGRRWYKTGKMDMKQNTFRDFISCAEFLAREGFTRKGNIVAQGGSAGGMLMGAVANMAPELFRGIIAEVPFVDVLTTMLDDTLPLTPPEWPEWGNPIESKEAYENIMAYSPYDRVEARAYPNILAVGGLTDPRVTYWEPAKWVAKLRELKTDDNLLLLKTNMGAGHGGASGRFDRLREVAFVHAFGLKVAGLTDAR